VRPGLGGESSDGLQELVEALSAQEVIGTAANSVAVRDGLGGESCESLQELAEVLSGQGVIGAARDRLLHQVEDMGWYSTQEFVSFAKDFRSQPESISSVLMKDFAMSALDAHRLRAAVMELLAADSHKLQPPSTPIIAPTSAGHTAPVSARLPTTKELNRPTFKDYKVVNTRKQSSKETSYGLKESDISPALARELDQFLEFMITPSPKNQEPPIRRTTAVVYCRHARLFLGWFLSSNRHSEQQSLYVDAAASPSLSMLFPDKNRDGAGHAYAFVMWLRETRKISVSYEANLLRGLIKLCKFIFRDTSQTDPTYDTKKTYEDIPAVAELRRLHRQADHKQKTSPRVSDERRKWLPWTEFLSVISLLQADVEADLRSYEQALLPTPTASAGTNQTTSRARRPAAIKPAAARSVAIKFQRYLILAFFSVVPDRQRTIRELVLGATFQREDESGTCLSRWCIGVSGRGFVLNFHLPSDLLLFY
jgi:hypothetical protein